MKDKRRSRHTSKRTFSSHFEVDSVSPLGLFSGLESEVKVSWKRQLVIRALKGLNLNVQALDDCDTQEDEGVGE